MSRLPVLVDGSNEGVGSFQDDKEIEEKGQDARHYLRLSLKLLI